MFPISSQNMSFSKDIHVQFMKAFLTTDQNYTGGNVPKVNFDIVEVDNWNFVKGIPGTVNYIATIDPGMAGIYVISCQLWHKVTGAPSGTRMREVSINSEMLGLLGGNTKGQAGVDNTIPTAVWAGYLPDRDRIYLEFFGDDVSSGTVSADGVNGWFSIARLGNMAS